MPISLKRAAAPVAAAITAVLLATTIGQAATPERHLRGAARPDPFAAHFGTATGGAAAAAGAACTVGEVLLTASPTATAGGVPANGQLLPIDEHTGLFSLLGTTYGGDGKSTFALPDLRPVAPDHMTYSICEDGVWPQF
jgi:hypothetical protein